MSVDLPLLVNPGPAGGTCPAGYPEHHKHVVQLCLFFHYNIYNELGVMLLMEGFFVCVKTQAHVEHTQDAAMHFCEKK